MVVNGFVLAGLRLEKGEFEILVEVFFEMVGRVVAAGLQQLLVFGLDGRDNNQTIA